MNFNKIVSELKNISSKIIKENFIYDFLLAFGLPKSSINRLKKGDYNQSKKDGEIIWTKKIYFKAVLENEDVHDLIDEISKNTLIEKQKIRFIIVTDFKTFLSKDIKTNDTLDIEITKLDESLNFFLPLIGREKIILDKENPADIKAANKMGKLYDQIIKDNKDYNLYKYRDHLNLFFTRLLFLYYADDSEIFKKNQFLNAITKFTEEDGSDLKIFFKDLFAILNTTQKINVPQYIKDFPYVNGNLFNENINLPNLSKTSRKMIIEGASLDWQMINPDIFGSMLQAIINQDDRSNLGIHYTSVSNILKLIKPLFLDDLYEDFLKSKNEEKKLEKILREIYNLKIFDPACGSGNFLIISYKELAKLEVLIFKELQKINKIKWSIAVSGIKLNNFYGIEISNHACEITKLSMWLSEHQMNRYFEEVFGRTKPSLPLQNLENIINKNATRLNWLDVCKKLPKENVCILGNPPYLGGKKLNAEQKQDMISSGLSKMLQLDYIGCWFVKAANYIQETNSRCAFVSTSSICQGEQVHLLWNYILSKKLEIFYAHTPFKWSNSARGQAGVFCIIVGLRNSTTSKDKFIFDDNNRKKVKNISPYLIEGPSILVTPQKKNISKLPIMTMGSNPVDGKNLIVTKKEYQSICVDEKKFQKYFKKFISGNEFTNSDYRYCLWISDEEVKDAMNSKFISNRINSCKKYRENSSSRDAKKSSSSPHKFCYSTFKNEQSIIIPKTSTSARFYLPIGFLNKDTVAADGAMVIYNPEPYLFSILSSRLHTLWLSTCGGRHASGFRYSVKLVYNTFPVPEIDKKNKKILEKFTFDILDEREKYSDKNIDFLYNIETMPSSLKKIHLNLDEFYEKLYDINYTSDENYKINKLLNFYEKNSSNDNLI